MVSDLVRGRAAGLGQASRLCAATALSIARHHRSGSNESMSAFRILVRTADAAGLPSCPRSSPCGISTHIEIGKWQPLVTV